MHNPTVLFTVHSKSFEGTARTVDKHNEPNLVEEVSSLVYAKYGWSNGLIVELILNKEHGNKI